VMDPDSSLAVTNPLISIIGSMLKDSYALMYGNEFLLLLQ
jgi:hypothetical protein